MRNPRLAYSRIVGLSAGLLAVASMGACSSSAGVSDLLNEGAGGSVGRGGNQPSKGGSTSVANGSGDSKGSTAGAGGARAGTTGGAVDAVGGATGAERGGASGKGGSATQSGSPGQGGSVGQSGGPGQGGSVGQSGGPGQGGGVGQSGGPGQGGGVAGGKGGSQGQGGAGSTGPVTGGTGGTQTGSDGTAAPAAPDGSPVAQHGQLQVAGTTLKDRSGAAVQLKGVSSQWLNWMSIPYAESKSGLQFMRDKWKLTVIRAAMGVDAAGGYLNPDPDASVPMQTRVESIVQNAIDLGVYVIVDWHTEKAVEQQADSIKFFTQMAQKYGKYPNVIYEPYNEPNRKDTRSQPYTWDQIKVYHEAVVAAIRAVDPDNLIILGTPTYSQRVDQAAQNPVQGTNLMYTLHFYACTHKQELRAYADTAIGQGLPIFITEFGLTPADGGSSKNNNAVICEEEGKNWFSWMAKNNISGVGWKFNHMDPSTASTADRDASNILTADAPADGPWTDNYLSAVDPNGVATGGGIKGGGHGLLVVNWIRE